MRLIFIVLFLLFPATIYAQLSPALSDTALLLNPHGKPAPESLDLSNAMALWQPSYSMTLNDDMQSIATEAGFRQFLKEHHSVLDTVTLYLYVQGEEDLPKAKAVSRLLQEEGLSNYQVVSMNLYRSSLQPLSFQEATAITDSTRADTNAANFCIIRVTSKTLTARLGGRLCQLKNTAALRSFIAKNKTILQSGMIVLSVSGDIPYKKIEPVIKALGDQGLNRFNLVVPLEEAH